MLPIDTGIKNLTNVLIASHAEHLLIPSAVLYRISYSFCRISPAVSESLIQILSSMLLSLLQSQEFCQGESVWCHFNSCSVPRMKCLHQKCITVETPIVDPPTKGHNIIDLSTKDTGQGPTNLFPYSSNTF